jgi:hypothetical protein
MFVTLHQSSTADLDFSPFSNTTLQDFEAGLQQGNRYAVFEYVMSIIVYSFNRSSKIIVAKNKTDLFLKSLPYTLLTLLLGWWSPFGFFHTLRVLYGNFSGGTDVSPEIKEHIKNQNPLYQYGMI